MLPVCKPSTEVVRVWWEELVSGAKVDHWPHLPFISSPYCTSRLEPQLLRVLFLHRLRPLPLSARACRCGRLLDVLGHHWSACAVVGTLGRSGFPLENEAGRVRTDVLVRDPGSWGG